ncbi:unnamed protein product [Spirodela intermedia]|uniref:Uncharacterized protein n=1 Tax=Spirodela intermedia TaxID=51605 RepID=A0A7I8JKD9_SPIIN|nr:unnamed protein product [Spirodela intermedia]CAA6670646.1 unnamed protein product [Spirodela intermedia]
MGVIPQLSRPPIQGIRGIPPLVAPVVRPAVPIVAPAEKPQTTVYVGKIASTVENEFLESLLRLCGPVKSWKRAENPSDGTFRGFGFCEFESAEGVLRALRLLNKLNMDGQELVLNVNQATREYLERYVDKKTEREKLKESEAKGSEPENGSPSGPEKQEPPKPADESPEANEESENKEKQDNAQKFGIVSEEDRDADRDALERLTNMMQERLKNKPLLPPPPFETASDTAKSNSEAPSKSRDGDSDVDIIKHEDRERDLKRDKERELERYERERERERVRREREREMKIRESERLYKDLVKDWESREREKENQRLREMEREKERARERRREIKDQEIDSDDDDTRKRRHRSSMLEEKRRKRQREKEEDLADRLREEEEIAEAKKRVIEELKRKEESRLSGQENGDKGEVAPEEEMLVEDQPELPAERPEANFSFDGENDSAGEEALRSGDGNDNGNGNGNGMLPDLPTASEPKQGSNISSLKLGFGLMASGKRAAVPSVFHQEDDEGVQDKKMRPLVPIDYSTEELQAVQATASGPSANLVAAAEFAKRISVANPKEDRPEPEERSRRSSQRDRSRDDDEHGRTRDVHREKTHERPHRAEMRKTRMRPWISKKITEFLGEEETTLVDYIVSSTREHVHASQMLELLQSILDDEAEMFVLKMWRMLIFEIKKVETGLALKTK